MGKWVAHVACSFIFLLSFVYCIDLADLNSHLVILGLTPATATATAHARPCPSTSLRYPYQHCVLRAHSPAGSPPISTATAPGAAPYGCIPPPREAAAAAPR